MMKIVLPAKGKLVTRNHVTVKRGPEFGNITFRWDGDYPARVTIEPEDFVYLMTEFFKPEPDFPEFVVDE